MVLSVSALNVVMLKQFDSLDGLMVQQQQQQCQQINIHLREYIDISAPAHASPSILDPCFGIMFNYGGRQNANYSK